MVVELCAPITGGTKAPMDLTFGAWRSPHAMGFPPAIMGNRSCGFGHHGDLPAAL